MWSPKRKMWSPRLINVETKIAFGQLILRKIIKNCCHQMSDFKAKMHQNPKFGKRWGSLQRSPDPLAGFKGAYF